MNKELQQIVCKCIQYSATGDTDGAVREMAIQVKSYSKKYGTYDFIKYCVYAAEIMANSKLISKSTKKQCVVSVLEMAGIEVTKEIDDMIEKAVDELNHYTKIFAAEFLKD